MVSRPHNWGFKYCARRCTGGLALMRAQRPSPSQLDLTLNSTTIMKVIVVLGPYILMYYIQQYRVFLPITRRLATPVVLAVFAKTPS